MITATTAGPNSSNSQEVETTATTVVRTTTRTPTTTATPTPTPTATPTPTPTPTSSAPPKPTNSLDVDTEEIDGQAHHFLTYSLQEARLQIYQQLLDNDYPNGARAIVALSTYPTQDSRQSEALTVAESDLIHGVNSADTTLTIRLDFDAPSEPFYLWSMLIDANTEMADATSGDVDTLAQTDRLIVANNRLQRDPPALEKETIRHDRYERINVEGRYLLQFSGRGPYSDWTAGFTASKVGYIETKLTPRTREYAQYARAALNDGSANALGTILDRAAENNGITGSREKIDFLIDFVQNLPYVPDDVSSGHDEYPKYVIESLVEAGGDCEDSSVLLASLLLSDAFGYGTVLFILPGHMAVGIKGADDIPGSYYEYEGNRYYYIETTGEGWEIGEIPEEYRDSRARVLTI